MAIYAFMAANQAEFPILAMAKTLGVAPSGYYRWRKRPPDAKELRDRRRLAILHGIHLEHGKSYGTRKLHQAMAARGKPISERQVRRLMALGNLRCETSKAYRLTTKRVIVNFKCPGFVNFKCPGFVNSRSLIVCSWHF